MPELFRFLQHSRGIRITPKSELPAPIQTFIDATNRGDIDAFLSVFADNAYLSDWGRAFNGHTGIASWNQTDNIGKQAHFELASFREAEGAYGVTLKVSGNGYNGTGDDVHVGWGDDFSSCDLA